MPANLACSSNTPLGNCWRCLVWRYQRYIYQPVESNKFIILKMSTQLLSIFLYSCSLNQSHSFRLFNVIIFLVFLIWFIVIYMQEQRVKFVFCSCILAWGWFCILDKHSLYHYQIGWVLLRSSWELVPELHM